MARCPDTGSPLYAAPTATQQGPQMTLPEPSQTYREWSGRLHLERAREAVPLVQRRDGVGVERHRELGGE